MPTKQWNVGDALTASDMNLWTGPLAIIKPADTSRTSNTTLADDPDLIVPVAASTTYNIHGQVFYDGAANTDMKFTFTIPAGATGVYTPTRQQPGGTFVGMFAAGWTDNLVGNTTGVGASMTITVEGILAVAGT